MYYFLTAISNSPLRNLYTYSYDEEIEPGTRVCVSFGKKKKQVAYIIKQIDPSQVPEGIEIKQISELIDSRSYIKADYFELLLWTQNYYLAPPGKVFDLIYKSIGDSSLNHLLKTNRERAPKTPKKLQKTYLAAKTFEIKKDISLLSGQNISQQGMDIIQYLMFFPDATLEDIIENLSLKSPNPLRTLIKNDIITLKDASKSTPKELTPSKINLTTQQSQLIRDFSQSFSDGQLKHLIYGITGSGKTEVYFEIMEEILSCDKQVLFMLPEIALTPQIIQRTRKRFPEKKVEIYHSNLTKTQRKQAFYQAIKSETDILLGTRSSVWMPLDRLGLIVVDEEHDESYMQSENSPVYDAKTVAEQLSVIKNIPIIMGSATPDIGTYFKSLSSDMKLHTLKSRPKGLTLPEIVNVDLNNSKKLKGFLTNEVLKGIEETAKNSSQCMILTGKKGFASYVACNVCGHTLRCPHCDVSLTYHKSSGDLRCHYCGYCEKMIYQCPSCSNLSLVPRGFGTERVEEQLQRLFPELRIIRVDRDKVPNVRDVEKAWEMIEKRQVDIVVGTRMISKGVDFPAVQLVVILNADHMLYFPDFRSAERTFSLIHQMSGRAGRGKKNAGVILQSYSPQADPIRFAEKNDYESFYKSEIKNRLQGEYPPYKKLILFESKDKDSERALKRLKELKLFLENQKNLLGLQILGPVEAFISKISNKYRFHMLLKIDDNDDIMNEVKKTLKDNSDYLKGIHLIVDPNRMIV